MELLSECLECGRRFMKIDSRTWCRTCGEVYVAGRKRCGGCGETFLRDYDMRVGSFVNWFVRHQAACKAVARARG